MQAALGGETAWTRIGLRQLSGMLIIVFARTHMQARPHPSFEYEPCKPGRSRSVTDAGVHSSAVSEDERDVP